jgi:hypothetical protein
MSDLDIPPQPAQRVTALYAWIAVAEDGEETIVFQVGQDDIRPLISSSRELANLLRPVAETEALRYSTKSGKPVGLVLRTFWS